MSGCSAVWISGSEIKASAARVLAHRVAVAYLLLRRDAPQPRQRLAFLLTHQLRKVLHTLRRELPETDRLIDIRPRTLRWRPDAPLWLDVEEFEKALTEGRLEEAVEIYSGELLEGRYDEWLLEERERLAGLHLEALERLARQHERNQRWPDAIRYAERLVAYDPLREESHRLLMQLCHTSGDRAGRSAHITFVPRRWRAGSGSHHRRRPAPSTSHSWQ